MKRFIAKLINGEHLGRNETYDLFMLLDEALDVNRAVVLSLLAAKGVSLDEVAGAHDYVMERAIKIHCPDNIVDIVGTGGDNSGTFNVSTTSSIVLASCGVPTVKHGGGKSTSLSGGADLIRALGISLHTCPLEAAQFLQKFNYLFVQASLFNPVFKKYGSVRSLVGFPSIFNVLGPLSNPALPKRQVLGVYSRNLMPIVANILIRQNMEHALVVHSFDGLDELSISAPNYVMEIKSGEIKEYVIHPNDVGIDIANLHECKGGDTAANAAILTGILGGTVTGPKLNLTLLNSAAGLLVSGVVTNLRDGIEMAREIIYKGRTVDLLNTISNTAI